MLVVMPEGMSPERVAISRAHGADVLLIGDFHVTAALEHARILGERPGYFHPGQFDSEWNVTENREWLGAEILAQLPEPPDALVVGVGTGGTLIGVGQAFRAVNPDVLVVGLEPGESRTICCGEIAMHAIEGISDGFVPGIVARHRDEICEFLSVSSDDALAEMRRLAHDHGIFVGPSSGAHMLAAKTLRRRRPELRDGRHPVLRRGREVHRRPPRPALTRAGRCDRTHTGGNHPLLTPVVAVAGRPKPREGGAHGFDHEHRGRADGRRARRALGPRRRQARVFGGGGGGRRGRAHQRRAGDGGGGVRLGRTALARRRGDPAVPGRRGDPRDRPVAAVHRARRRERRQPRLHGRAREPRRGHAAVHLGQHRRRGQPRLVPERVPARRRARTRSTWTSSARCRAARRPARSRSAA